MKKLSKEQAITRIMDEISKREVGADIYALLADSYAPKKAKSDSKSKKSSEPKDYGTPVFVSDKKFVRYQNADGSYLAHKGIRSILNKRIKDMGGTWSSQAKAWAFPTVKDATNCVKNIDRIVTKDQIDAEVKSWSK